MLLPLVLVRFARNRQRYLTTGIPVRQTPRDPPATLVAYCISMRSRRPVSSPSGGLCGTANSLKPCKTSNPARRKCPAARRRRSPGTSTYAATPKSERRLPRDLLRGSGVSILEPHLQLVAFDPGARRFETCHRVRQEDVPPVASDPH